MQTPQNLSAKILLALLVGWSLFGRRLSAYPGYIGYGYQSCAGCHYNPYGNGPLTDYGRSVAATEIADRQFWSKTATDDDISEASGFLFAQPKQEWIRPSLSYRDLYLMQNVGEENAKSMEILMDFSGSVVIQALEKNAFTMVANFGYAPVPMGLKGQKGIEQYRSREAYMGYRLSKDFGFYLGLMDKVYGIRIPDHIAYSRMLTGNTQNDQTYAALFHYTNKLFELAVQPFIGNLVQDIQLRQRGLSTQIDFNSSSSSRLGASWLISTSDYLNYVMGAAHFRKGFGEGNSILAEVGLVEKTVRATSDQVYSNYSMLQGAYHLRRGLFGLLMLEHKNTSTTSETVNYRVGPGLQYFPVQRLELRFDIYDSISSSDSGSDSLITAAGQMHWWL